MNVTVAVATFGDEAWTQLARSRAVPSALDLEVPVVHVHRSTLHDARNAALDKIGSEYVCFLDADDKLEPGYFEAMTQSTADIRVPSVRYMIANCPQADRMPAVAGHRHTCTADCLLDGNWIVIGAVARAQLLRDVGGWRDFDWSEDWDLWLRCHLAGATIEPVRAAVYRAYARQDSRNRAPDREHRLAAHRAIAAANGIPSP